MTGSNSPDFACCRNSYRFETEFGPHIFIPDGSQVYAIDATLDHDLCDAALTGPDAVQDVLFAHGLTKPLFGADLAVTDVPLRSLSLAVAQKCNLGCSYCYAQGGSFGGAEKAMDWPVAVAAIFRLFEQARPGEPVNIAFLGGEPLTNRVLVRRAAALATQLGAERRVPVNLAITTNGTLLRPDDGDFFEQYGFSVTISLDGIGDIHDRLRPYKNGRGSYGTLISRVEQLLDKRRTMRVSARVTVTPNNLGIQGTLDHLIALGFDSVGFSPMLFSPNRRDEMTANDLDSLLHEMITCGREFERRIVAGQQYPFANMISAMQEIHRGTHRPYPCGAGAGYFGVSAAGGLFACHRFVDDANYAMGNVWAGVDQQAQKTWLQDRKVDKQEPCRICWARYLCGGGCHHEVLYRGRPACDLIRGWLHYCLQAYVHIMEKCPAYFEPLVLARSSRQA